ncbi:MAG TPA: hypothetical protein VFY64_07870 [Nitrososphaeraceae archaeon]|nr:hypothetical protein [Nitrososphaeraceae archaeon]
MIILYNNLEYGNWDFTWNTNQVIREWLAGESRDKIASDTKLATGTITM